MFYIKHAKGILFNTYIDITCNYIVGIKLGEKSLLLYKFIISLTNKIS